LRGEENLGNQKELAISQVRRAAIGPDQLYGLGDNLKHNPSSVRNENNGRDHVFGALEKEKRSLAEEKKKKTETETPTRKRVEGLA